MPFLELGRNNKINPVENVENSPIAMQVASIQSNNQHPQGLVFTTDEFKTVPEPLAMEKAEVVMVVPNAFNPTREIKFGLVFMTAAFSTMVIFSIFVYFGYKQYKNLLTNKNKQIVDVENPQTIVNAAHKTPVNSFIANIESNSLSFPLNQSSNAFKTKWVQDKKPIQMINNENNELEGPSKSYRVNGFPSGTKSISTNNIIKPVNFYLNTTKNGFKESSNIFRESSEKNKVKQIEMDLKSLRNTSNSLSAFITEKADSRQNSRKKRKHIFRKNKRKTYSKREMVELEPIQTYQLLEYCYDDGDLLVTDLVFPSASTMDTKLLKDSLNDLTEMRRCLLDSNTDSATKTLELFRFINMSFGMKNYENPLIFTMPYGLLVDSLVNFNLVSMISSNVSLILQSAYVETIIMYCISCWKYDKIKKNKIERYFKAKREQPYVQPQLKVYEYIITLMTQGFRSNLLEEVLIFFSMSPSPHMLSNILQQPKIEKTPEMNRLFKYLLEKLQKEHHSCCANPEKWKHWELTTSGVEAISDQEEMDTDSSSRSSNVEFVTKQKPIMQETLKDLRENIIFEEDLQRRKHDSYMNLRELSISDVDENEYNLNPKHQQHQEVPHIIEFERPKLAYTATSLLPGSLVPSPVHTQSFNFDKY